MDPLDHVVDRLLGDLCSGGSPPFGNQFFDVSVSECASPASVWDAEGPQGSLAELVDRLLDDLFSAHSRKPSSTGTPQVVSSESCPDDPRHPLAQNENQKCEPAVLGISAETASMYADVAATYFRPVRQFLSYLRQGPVSKDWIEICAPSIDMVARTAGQLELPAAGLLRRLEEVLKEADTGSSRTIEGAVRDRILRTYHEVMEAIPALCTPSEEEDRKEVVILHALLRMVPDVGKVTLDRLFGAGLVSVEMLSQASPEALERTTGISSRLSSRICDAVATYLGHRAARQALSSPREWWKAIEPVLGELENGHTTLGGREGRGAAGGTTLRKQRRVRAEAALKMDVLLAEMGETELVEELRRLPIGFRVRRLRGFAEALRGESPSRPVQE